MMKIFTDDPSINKTKYTGQVWVNLKAERITCILHHVRKLVRDGSQNCAAKLTGAEAISLQQVLAQVSLKPAQPDQEAEANQLVPQPPTPQQLEKASGEDSATTASQLEAALDQELKATQPEKERTLKKEIRDVSLDSPSSSQHPLMKRLWKKLRLTTVLSSLLS